MSERVVFLIEHHAKEYIPSLAERGVVNELEIFFKLGVASVDYGFLWDRGRLNRFTSRINEAIEAYNTNRVRIISEKDKNKDHICQECGNLYEGKCRLETNNISCDL